MRENHSFENNEEPYLEDAVMLKKYVALFLLSVFLTPSYTASAFADRHWGRNPHEDFHREMIVHRLPPGYVSLMAGELALLYSAGMFYRYTPAGYVVVTPPVGAVVPALPPGYTTVMVDRTPYYYYGYTYYAPVPNGYAVAAPPVAPAVPVVPVSPVSSANLPPQPALYANAKEESVNRDVYEIYIPNGNGSYTSVTLRKTEKGFLGHQGEFYTDHPTTEQLTERYTKK